MGDKYKDMIKEWNMDDLMLKTYDYEQFKKYCKVLTFKDVGKLVVPYYYEGKYNYSSKIYKLLSIENDGKLKLKVERGVDKLDENRNFVKDDSVELKDNNGEWIVVYLHGKRNVDYTPPRHYTYFYGDTNYKYKKYVPFIRDIKGNDLGETIMKIMPSKFKISYKKTDEYEYDMSYIGDHIAIDELYMAEDENSYNFKTVFVIGIRWDNFGIEGKSKCYFGTKELFGFVIVSELESTGMETQLNTSIPSYF